MEEHKEAIIDKGVKVLLDNPDFDEIEIAIDGMMRIRICRDVNVSPRILELKEELENARELNDELIHKLHEKEKTEEES